MPKRKKSKVQKRRRNLKREMLDFLRRNKGTKFTADQITTRLHIENNNFASVLLYKLELSGVIHKQFITDRNDKDYKRHKWWY